MSKYFEGSAKLPLDIITLEYDSVCEEALKEVLSEENKRVALSIRLPGLPLSSLGYVFIIETKDGKHTIMDIKNIIHFREINTNSLFKIICHSSGIRYNPDVQAEFHRIRNEIGID